MNPRPHGVRLKLALIGDPVAHSLSPSLQQAFLDEARLAGTYETIRTPAGDGGPAIDRLRAAGYHGLGVTTPLKEEAFARSDRRDALAEASGSVNTIVFEDGKVAGYNTDGAGAVGAMLEATERESLAGLRILVLGAGPTARAAVAALMNAGASVRLWNRTVSRAHAACDALGCALWQPGDTADAVLAALTPMSRPDNEELARSVSAAPVVVDANYGPRATLAATLARPVHDGLAMLRASARASFELFISQTRSKERSQA